MSGLTEALPDVKQDHPFRPHITLGRLKNGTFTLPVQSLLPTWEPVVWEIDSIDEISPPFNLVTCPWQIQFC